MSRPDAGNGLRALVARLLAIRFVRFGTVGASGTVVNLVVLWLAQEKLLVAVEPPSMRLNLALALAILCATINNFAWNRLWTWADRGPLFGARPLQQFFKYAAACWLGMAIQFVLTKLLAGHMQYLLANVLSIVLASVFNFVANDQWTFEGLRLRRRRRDEPEVPR